MPIAISDTGQVQRIGEYDVVGMLGRGGMALVYDARGPDGRPYAVKTIEKKWLEAPGSHAMRRFMQEVATLERLQHPNVVRLHSHGIAAHPLGYELAFLVMERLDGKSLGEHLRARGRMRVPEVLTIGGEMIEALLHLDQHGIVHRDLKPGNVMIRRDGSAVLMDFGLARADDLTRLTKTNHVVGTPQYMSPERIYGEDFDIRSDIYALGIILFEMLTGERAPDDPRRIEWPDDLATKPEDASLIDLVEAMIAPEPTARPSPVELRRWVADIRTASGDEMMETVEAVPSPPLVRGPTDTVRLGSQLLSRVLSDTLDPAQQPQAPPEPYEVHETLPSSFPTTPRFLWVAFVVAAVIALPLSFVGGVQLKRHFAHATPLVEPITDARQAYRFGDQALKEGRYEVAIVALSRAVELEDGFADAHRRLADAYLSSGRIPEAKEHYRRYLDLFPEAPDADRIRGIFDQP